MFRDAYELAKHFTKPVVLSRRTVAGECSSGIGSYVIVNDKGWIVTAWHILEQIQKMEVEGAASDAHESAKASILADASLGQKERSKALGKLGRLPPEQTRNHSAWYGQDGIQLKDISGLPIADIAVGRLDPFDPVWMTSPYPIFKDPDKNFNPGVSLCKLGFPFHAITPTFDSTAVSFQLPADKFPMPLFPIDGIFTRICETLPGPGIPTPPFPIRFVETSSPGLRGQSGGPTFDSKGTIWAIQSQTMHLPLGFDPKVPGSKKGEKEHQFLNVGLGVHPTTIFGLFKDAGVDFQMSDY